MKHILMIIILSAVLTGCAGNGDFLKKDPESAGIIIVKKEAGRRDGSLYILPADEYVLLNKAKGPNDFYECVTVPLIIKGKEINTNSILFCLNKINDYAPMRNIYTICNDSNKILIENVLSNMAIPVRQEFILKDTDDIEFYFSK
jgi:hypothetical protein